ncbi:MAG: hypothetical protein J6U54_13420 [Clostridiales bacterium]|nr:hypothetical protein [Clostridiales bacterium]
MKHKSKREKIEKAMDELTQFEKEKMLQAWNIVKLFTCDVDDKRPWIYWEDIKKVFGNIYQDYDISDDQHVILQVLRQRLEEKVWIPTFKGGNQ